jgi:ethanolamine permease
MPASFPYGRSTSPRLSRETSRAGTWVSPRHRRLRPRRKLPRHHLRVWEADLLAVAGGLFPTFSVSDAWREHKTPNVALIAGGLLGLTVMLVVWFAMGGEAAGSFIGGVLLNMAVFGAMFSYLLQGLTFIQLRRRFPNRAAVSQSVRRARGGADCRHCACDHRLPARRSRLPNRRYRRGDLYTLAILYFAAYGRKSLVFSPEEEFAVKQRKGTVKI